MNTSRFKVRSKAYCVTLSIGSGKSFLKVSALLLDVLFFTCLNKQMYTMHVI